MNAVEIEQAITGLAELRYVFLEELFDLHTETPALSVLPKGKEHGAASDA